MVFTEFLQDVDFKGRLNLLCQEMQERLQEEEKFNKRRPSRMSLSYKGIRNNKEFARNFALVMNTNNDGEIVDPTAAKIFEKCVDHAVKNNSEFSHDLRQITEMTLTVKEFKKFGTVYKDEMRKIAREVRGFMLDKDSDDDFYNGSDSD